MDKPSELRRRSSSQDLKKSAYVQKYHTEYVNDELEYGMTTCLGKDTLSSTAGASTTPLTTATRLSAWSKWSDEEHINTLETAIQSAYNDTSYSKSLRVPRKHTRDDNDEEDEDADAAEDSALWTWEGKTDNISDDVALIETIPDVAGGIPYARIPPSEDILQDMATQYAGSTSGIVSIKATSSSSSTVYIDIQSGSSSRAGSTVPCVSVRKLSQAERLKYTPSNVYCCDAHTKKPFATPTKKLEKWDTGPCVWRCVHDQDAATGPHAEQGVCTSQPTATTLPWLYGSIVQEWPLRDLQPIYKFNTWKRIINWMQTPPGHTIRHMCIRSGRRGGRTRCIIRTCKMWAEMHPSSTIVCISLTAQHARTVGGCTVWELLGVPEHQYVDMYERKDEIIYDERITEFLKTVGLIVVDDVDLWSRRTMFAMLTLLVNAVQPQTRWLVSESVQSEYMRQYSKLNNRLQLGTVMRTSDPHIRASRSRLASVEQLAQFWFNRKEGTHVFDTFSLPEHSSPRSIPKSKEIFYSGPSRVVLKSKTTTVNSVTTNMPLSPATTWSIPHTVDDHRQDTQRRSDWLKMFDISISSQTVIKRENTFQDWARNHTASTTECYYYPRIVKNTRERIDYERMFREYSICKGNEATYGLAAVIDLHTIAPDGQVLHLTRSLEPREKYIWTRSVAQSLDVDMSVTIWPGARVQYVGRRGQTAYGRLGTVIFVPFRVNVPVMVLWDTAVLAEDLCQRHHEASEFKRECDRVFWEDDVCEMYTRRPAELSSRLTAAYINATVKYMPLRLVAALEMARVHEAYLPGCVYNADLLSRPHLCESLSVVTSHPECIRVRVSQTMIRSGLDTPTASSETETPSACYPGCRLHPPGVRST